MGGINLCVALEDVGAEGVFVPVREEDVVVEDGFVNI